MGVSKSDSIIIVGGGAFGLSTALHLAQKGHTDISVFDKDDSIPPRFSAANDLNKIARAEYEDPFYTDLTIVGSASCKGIRMQGPRMLMFGTFPPFFFRKRSKLGKHLYMRLISTRPASSIVSLGKRPRRLSKHYTGFKLQPKRMI